MDNNNFSTNSNQYLISQQDQYPTAEEIQNNNSNQIQTDYDPPSENNFIPLEVSLPPDKPQVNYPPSHPRTIYDQLNIPNPVSQNYNNNSPETNPNIYTGPSNIYDYQSNIPQNIPNMPIPQSIEEQQINIPAPGAPPDYQERPKIKKLI